MNIYSNITKNLKEDDKLNLDGVLHNNLDKVIEELDKAKYSLTKDDNWYHQLDNTSIVFEYENLVTDFETLLSRVREFQESIKDGVEYEYKDN